MYTIIPLRFQPKTIFEISISTFLRAGGAADGADESVEFCWIQTTWARAFEEPQVSNTKTTDKNSYIPIFYLIVYVQYICSSVWQRVAFKKIRQTESVGNPRVLFLSISDVKCRKSNYTMKDKKAGRTSKQVLYYSIS
jgi:hypothetical protein